MGQYSVLIIPLNYTLNRHGETGSNSQPPLTPSIHSLTHTHTHLTDFIVSQGQQQTHNTASILIFNEAGILSVFSSPFLPSYILWHRLWKLAAKENRANALYIQKQAESTGLVHAGSCALIRNN